MKFSALILLSLLTPLAYGQCVNTGFEATAPGSYTAANAVSGWTLSSRSGTQCANSFTSWSPGSPDFSIVATPIFEPIIGTMLNSPLGGTVVARMNDYTNYDYIATRLAQAIPVTTLNPYFNFAFAAVVENANHSNFCCENPVIFFQVRDANNNIISCLSHTIIAYPACPSSAVLSFSSTVGHVNWQTRTFDLSSFIGSTVTVEAIVSDCIYGEHRAYMYFDAQCSTSAATVNVQPAAPNQVGFCAGGNQAVINAPPSMAGYTWTIPSGASVTPGQYSLSTISASNVSSGQVFTVAYTSTAGCNAITLYTLNYSTVGAGTKSISASCLNGTNGSATVFPTGSGQGYNYAWYNSSNSVIATSSVANNLPPGSYNVIITALNAAGCGSAAVSVVIPAIGASFNMSATPSNSVCSGSGITAIANITGTAPASAYSYSWSPSLFLSTTSQQVSVITPTATSGSTAALIYSITVTPTMMNCPITNTFVIYVGNTVTPVLSTVAVLCDNSAPVQVNGIPPGGVFSGTGISSSGLITPVIGQTGSMSFSYQINLAGCTANALGSYSVNAAPSLTAYTSTTICAGESATLSAAGANTYSWSNGANTYSTSVTPPASTIMVVTGTQTPGGCSSTAAVTISVNANPTVTITGPDTSCTGRSVVLLAGGANSYSWNGAPGLSSQTVVALLGNQAYSVTGANASTGCRGSAVHQLFVIASPTLSVSGQTTVCSGDLLTLTASGASSYTWNGFGMGNTFTTVAQTNTTFTLIGTNGWQCSDTVHTGIVTRPCTSIHSVSDSAEGYVYFDQATSLLHLKGIAAVRVQAADLFGKLSYDTFPQPVYPATDLSTLEAGVYVIRVFSKTDVQTLKIFIAK